MKISCAAIAGNCEGYITRFLNVFQPVCDEVVVVRATGSLEPDRTLEIAESRGCVVGEYKNAIRPEWEHVDDFAAARNLSFDLATGDVIFWADTDDVLQAPDPGILRRIITNMPDRCRGLMVPYIVPSDGLEVIRERAIRRGEARWMYRVHESLNFGTEEPVLAKTNQIKFLHAPDEDRKRNDNRNLRIIEDIPREELSMSHRFHLFQSLRACGRKDESIAVAVETVSLPDIGRNEKYELLISLGQEANDQETRHQYYLQALRADPSRREAYGELALSSIMRSEMEDAFGWCRGMLGQRKPREWQWNARRKYYDYLGTQIHAMCLRANGKDAEANTRERNMFVRAGAKISLLHATRGRPEMAYKTKVAWFDRADNPEAVEHIYCIDQDDEKSKALALSRCVQNPGEGCVSAWNQAARVSLGKVLVQLSDDWVPTRGWDTAILDAIGDLDKPSVLAISDGARRDDLMCMAILTRARYEQQGWMFHPEFWSVYSDNWFTECAYRDGVVIDARDRIEFEHRHPAFGKAVMDEVYQRQNQQYAYVAGSKTIDRLRRGVLTSTEVDGWFNFQNVYGNLCTYMPDGARFCEVGVWLGKSLIWMAQRIQDHEKNGCRLVAVDTFRGEEGQQEHAVTVQKHGGSIRGAFEENLRRAEVSDMVDVVEGDSAESAAQFKDGEFWAVFVDAAHDYDSVVRDISAWWPKVKDGGILAGHDYQWVDVSRAVNEFAESHKLKVKDAGACWLIAK